MLKDIYRSYMLKNLFSDVSRFLKDNTKDLEWDKDFWLHKAGLTTYRPSKSVASGVSLFVLGIIAGGAAALAFAPKTGPDFRADVKDRAKDLLHRSQLKLSSAQEETARA